MTFSELGLSQTLLTTLAREGYDTPTPIQARAIPAVLEGRDVLAAAQTGTGKTAAFSLPLLQRLATGTTAANRAVRVLVLTPTRELAAQVEASVRTYGKGLKLTSTAIYGGVSAQPQERQLRRGVDVLVATPGRLLDHLQQGNVSLSSVQALVLDEADRMLDMGFIRDIRRIVAYLPEQRQTLLFSATFSNDIRKLAHRLLQEPTEIDVAPRNAAADCVDQQVLFIDRQRKRAALSWLIGSRNWRQVLVFTRTKHGANRLCKQLESDGLPSAALHGNKSQAARTRALSQFKAGDVRVLVATDIAARGLDIDALPHVINFELPNVAEDYVHRIGRTGRAGLAGQALSLVDREERGLLRDIQRLLGREIAPLQLDEEALSSLRTQPEAAPRPSGRPSEQRPGQKRHQPNRSQRRRRPPRQRETGSR